jgi:iron complex outermembrane receptor protein
MNRLKRIILTFSLALTSSLIAQITVSGTVTDASNGEALAGANVVVEGTSKGSAADANGKFTINNVSNGSTLTASMIGYEDMTMSVSRSINFSLEPSLIQMSGLEVLASRADEKTPLLLLTLVRLKWRLDLDLKKFLWL